MVGLAASALPLGVAGAASQPAPPDESRILYLLPVTDSRPTVERVEGLSASLGQGGPYQINNYVPDMVSGSMTPSGHALINFVAIQKNIGFTIAGASSQNSKVTPPSFNN